MKKVDARVKLLFIIVITTLAVLARDFVYLSILVAVAILLNIALGVDIWQAFKRLRFLFSVVVFITLVQSLTIKGGIVLVHIKNVNLITTKGLVFALEFLLRMSIIILSGLIATSTDGREMTDALLVMKLPYELVFMSGIALRFLPIFREEFTARLNAIALRGINIKKLSLPRKIKLYSYLISPTISGCIVRSHELSKSIQSRAFRAKKTRTIYRKLKMRYYDWLLFVATILLSATFLFFNYYYGAILTL